MLNPKAFTLFYLCAQVLLPSRINYYFITVPAQLKDFTPMDGFWNIVYFELAAGAFVVLSCLLLEWVEHMKRHNVYKEEKP